MATRTSTTARRLAHHRTHGRFAARRPVSRFIVVSLESASMLRETAGLFKNPPPSDTSPGNVRAAPGSTRYRVSALRAHQDGRPHDALCRTDTVSTLPG